MRGVSDAMEGAGFSFSERMHFPGLVVCAKILGASKE